MKRKLERGKELTELVKGSKEYTLSLINAAFRAQFPHEMDGPGYYIVETFDDHVIVSSWGDSTLKTDEYYRVAYTRGGDGAAGEPPFTFAARTDWEIVELTYQPQTTDQPALSERANPAKKRASKKFIETTTTAAQIELIESADSAENTDGPWRIKAIGNTADVVNANGRRYPAALLKAAVAEMQNHLHESAGQGMLRVKPTGESDHPKDKGHRRALLSETIINWDTVTFDGQHILLEGNLLGTAKGKDFRAQVKGGLKPGISQRGYGDSVIVTEGEQRIEEVTELTITGFDLTLPGDQADTDSGVLFVESTQGDLSDTPPTPTAGKQENETMSKEELLKFLAEHPELFKGVTKEQVESMNAEALKSFEESVRKALGIDAGADLAKELTEAAQAKRELTEAKQAKVIAEAITEQTKGLKYGKSINEAFVAAVQEAQPKTVEDVKAIVESKRKEYDALASTFKLAGMGFRGNGIDVLGPVLETETGTPEFARASHEITESLVRVGDPFVRRHAFNDVAKLSVNEIFALKYLERFDQVYGAALKEESRRFEEAETTLDLNLPYSVMRAIAAEALPELVSSSVFDFGVTDVSPFRLYFEKFTGETGLDVTVTNEAIDLDNADSEGWVALAQKQLTPGTVVITSSPAGTTYVEGTDYTIDYINGRLMSIPASNIPAGAALLANYHYNAIRKGENLPIQRGKVGTTFKIMDAKFDRLAAQITRETIVFSRAQIGWDAVTRTLVSLVNQIRRVIDKNLFYLALSAALRQANNSGGTWALSGTNYDAAVRAFGVASNKISYRYYTPTGILLSENVADIIANWEGFTQAGSRPDATLNANGFIGKLKGKPVFQTTEFSDAYGLVVNREIVAHRVFLPMRLDGPHDAFDPSTLQLLPTQEWYAEESSASDTPVPEKAAFVKFS